MPVKAKASVAKPPAARKPTTPCARASKPTASLRQPPAPKSVGDLVTQETRGAHNAERVGAAHAVPTRTAASPKRATRVTRKEGSARRRTTVDFEPELAKRRNVHGAIEDVERSQVVGEAVEAWLRQGVR